MKFLIILMLYINHLLALCQVQANQEENDFLLFHLTCKYNMGDAENRLDAKEHMLRDAKIVVINRVGSIVNSTLNVTQRNDQPYSIIEHSIEVISPAITTIEIQNEKMENALLSMEVAIKVDKNLIERFLSKLNLNNSMPLQQKVEELSSNSLINQAVVMERERIQTENDRYRSNKFKVMLNNNIINTLYKNNLTINRNIVKTSSYETTIQQEKPNLPLWQQYAIPSKKIECLRVTLESTFHIDSSNVLKAREAFPGWLPSFVNKIGKLDASNQSFQRSIECLDSKGGLGTDIDVILAFENTGQEEILFVPMYSCTRFKITEDISDIKRFKPVQIVGFELHKTLEEKIAYEEKIKQYEQKQKEYETTQHEIFRKEKNYRFSLLVYFKNWLSPNSYDDKNAEVHVSITIYPNRRMDYRLISSSNNSEFNQKLLNYLEHAKHNNLYPTYFKNEPFNDTLVFQAHNVYYSNEKR